VGINHAFEGLADNTKNQKETEASLLEADEPYPKPVEFLELLPKILMPCLVIVCYAFEKLLWLQL